MKTNTPFKMLSSLPSSEMHTTIDILKKTISRTPDQPALHRPGDNADWRILNWKDFGDDVSVIAGGLSAMGLRKGDSLAIIAATRYEWLAVEFACFAIGAIVVGVDPHASPETLKEILRLAAPSFVLLDHKEQLADIGDAEKKAVSNFILIDGESDDLAGHFTTYKQLAAWGRDAEDKPATGRVEPDDPALLIFTSGTTGLCKGISYTHRQLMAAAKSIINVFTDINDTDRIACWLPMAHLFQQVVNVVAVQQGVQIFFVPSPRELPDFLPKIKPTIFIGVPRFYEKVHEGILARINEAPSLMRRFLFFMLHSAIRHNLDKGKRDIFASWINNVAEKILLARLRGALGGAIRFMLTGTAPIPLELLRFYHGVGLPLFEAYGLSENIIPMACNRPGKMRLGSVGQPLSENIIRFETDGEILVKGPGLFSGYYHDDDNSAIDKDGFYHTGDWGYEDKDGFLFLMGRKADIIKTSTGRRISPVQVETVLKQSAYIEDVVVIGNGRKNLSALIVPAGSSVSISTITAELDRLNGLLSPHEQIISFTLLSKPFSIENGEVTSSLKLRRQYIEERYKREIETMYHRRGIS